MSTMQLSLFLQSGKFYSVLFGIILEISGNLQKKFQVFFRGAIIDQNVEKFFH